MEWIDFSFTNVFEFLSSLAWVGHTIAAVFTPGVIQQMDLVSVYTQNIRNVI